MTVLFLSGYEHYKRCIKITSPTAYEVWLKAHSKMQFCTVEFCMCPIFNRSEKKRIKKQSTSALQVPLDKIK